MALEPTNRTEKLDLRLTKSAKQTLQAAAVVARKSVSEFVLETALNEAEERLADRRVFTLDAERWEAFVAALDAPPHRHPRLERLFREKSVFDPES
ncbi:MAG: type II toxin-antitoxin system TacA family antitoxin [Methylovirgula sp.]